MCQTYVWTCKWLENWSYWERKARGVHICSIIVVNTLLPSSCSHMFRNFGPITKAIHFNTLHRSGKRTIDIRCRFFRSIRNRIRKKVSKLNTSSNSISSSAFQSGHMSGKDKLSCWKTKMSSIITRIYCKASHNVKWSRTKIYLKKKYKSHTKEQSCNTLSNQLNSITHSCLETDLRRNLAYWRKHFICIHYIELQFGSETNSIFGPILHCFIWGHPTSCIYPLLNFTLCSSLR